MRVSGCPCMLSLFIFSIAVTLRALSHPVFSGNKQLEKLIVHPQKGTVYVAAVNRLYQLSPDSLVKQGEYQTGPKHTNGQCLPPEWKATSSGQDLSCLSSYKLVDFHNRLFLLNHTGSKGDDTLIVCGNAYAGECNFHSAENVSLITISSKDIFDETNHPHQPILASQYKTLSTAAVTSTFQNGAAALFVASVTPSSFIITTPVMNVVNLNASDLLARVGEQSLSRWNERGVTHRPRQAFKSGQFVYFTSYQYPTKDNVKYKTVLSRICTNDLGLGDDPPTILAYMEASIKCGSGSMPFDYLTSQTVVRPGTTLQTALQVNAMEDILIASFAQNYNPDPKIDSVSGLSTICIFKMSEIEQQFKNTQEDCRKGKPGTMKGLSRDGTIGEQCQDITKVWNGMSCSPTNKVNFVLEVTTPIVSQPVYNLTSGQITAVAATVVGETTVVFVGTNNGSIIKLQLDSRTSVVELSNSPVVELTSSKEILLMSFSHDYGYLFVMSKSEVVKVPTHTCSMLSSCNECVASNDPHCGFCMLENKCSSQLDCQQSTDPHRWLQSNSSQCIAFIPVSPLKAPIATPKQIFVQVLNVPMTGSFECVFGDQGSTVATRSGTSQSLFSCQTPQLNRLPGSGESLDVSVSLKSTLTGIAFVPDITTLTLFNCRVHTTCSSCTASTLPCGWCLCDGLCTDTSYDCRIADYWKERTVNQCVRTDTNQIGKDATSKASAVYYDVRINTGREEHTVLVNQDVGIPCGNWKVTAQTVRWSHNGRNITSKSKIATDGSLYLTSFGVFDSGTFQCYVNEQLHFQATIKAVEAPGFLQPELTDLTDRTIGRPIVANASDDIRILCKASGYPKPSISWSVNGRLLPSSIYSRVSIKNSDTLIIKNAQLSDSGTYSCTVSNLAGSNSEKSVVDIQPHQSRPRIARRPHRQIELKSKKWVAYIGEHRAYARHRGTLLVECEVNGTPIPTVSWEKGGVPVGKKGFVRVRENGQLRIARAQQESMGTYTCVASNSMGRDQQNIEIVLEGLPKPRLYINGKQIRDKHLLVLEGSETEVCCFVVDSHSDADVQWLNVEGTDGSKECVTIRGTEDATTAGKYSCKGHNVVGSSTTFVNVSIERLAFVTHPKDAIHIDSSPVAVSSKGIELPTSSHLTMHCSAVTNPKIVWQKDGSPLSFPHSTLFGLKETQQGTLTTSTLNIHAVRMQDSGVYTCIVSNDIITKNSSVAVAVGGYPIIWDSDASVSREGNMIRSSVGIDFTSLVGNTIMFDCPIINTEPMSVVWTKNGNSVLGTNVEVVNRRTLIIRNASISNEGEFMCQAKNKMGSANRTTKVQVHKKPKMWLKLARLGNDRYEYDVNIKEEVRIQCGGDGYPSPKITWKKGQQILPVSGRMRGKQSNGMMELVISDVQMDDAWTYICEADNVAGSERLEVQVFVQAGDLAFNVSLPDISAAVTRLEFTGAPNVNEGMRWIEIDPSGRLTNYEPSDSWFEEAEDSEQLKSGEVRERELDHYVDAALLKERIHHRESRSVVGDEDERMEVLDTTKWPYQTAGIIIFRKRGSKEEVHCTGTLINKRHVLTAGHCISDGNGKFYRNFLFYPAANAHDPDNPYPFGNFSWRKLYTVQGYHNGRHLAYDYGVIVLKESVNQYIAFREAKFTSASGDTMAINQYPRDRQHDPDYPTMWQSTCPVGSPLIAGSDLVYGHTCDTSDGSSGSGMYLSYSSDSSPAVVLVHTGIGDQTVNRAVTITRSKFLQLCHWIKMSKGEVEPDSACDVKTTKGDTVQTKN